MKIRLDVSRERYDELSEQLRGLGVEIDEDAALVLSEAGRYADSLLLRERGSGALTRVDARDIISVESAGREIEVYTVHGVFTARERLYQIQGRLDPEDFLRVSNGVIVALRHIRSIKPALSMRFALTLSDGRRADVTRSCYYAFKEALGI